MRCVTCHLVLGGALLTAVLCGTAQDRPTRDLPAGSCLTGDCHRDYETLEHAHRPVATGVCTICHRLERAEDHYFALTREGADLCATCHWEIEAEGNTHNDLLPGGCTICHDPHGTGFSFLLAGPVNDACRGCHGEILDGRSVRHTPVGSESCTVCHDPHASGPEPSPIAERCARCHDTIQAEAEALGQVHEPFATGTCDACHDPHGSNHLSNLRQEVPALCFECHAEIQAMVETSRHSHVVAGQPDGCLVCHAPHASSLGLRLRADPLTLCSGCHSNEAMSEDGSPLLAIAHEVEARSFLHGPIRQRDCAACHNVHGSDHFRLLRQNYSAEFYAPFDLENYALCFSCHPERGVLVEKTTALTDFRNGDLNLHYLHVNKPRQGRTCRACHDTHGSDAPKHIRGWVKFGQWRLPIVYEKTETGGSCQSGCHEPVAYDRETPVDYDAGDGPLVPPGPPGPPPPDGGDGLGPAVQTEPRKGGPHQ